MAVQDRTRLIDAAHDRIRARFPGAVLACQKSIFDKLADGGVSAPPGAAPQIFNLSRGSFAFGETAESGGFCASGHPLQNSLAPLCGTSEFCKVDIFSPANGICLRKNIRGSAAHVAGTDLTGGSAIVGWVLRGFVRNSFVFGFRAVSANFICRKALLGLRRKELQA